MLIPKNSPPRRMRDCAAGVTKVVPAPSVGGQEVSKTKSINCERAVIAGTVNARGEEAALPILGNTGKHRESRRGESRQYYRWSNYGLRPSSDPQASPAIVRLVPGSLTSV